MFMIINLNITMYKESLETRFINCRIRSCRCVIAERAAKIKNWNVLIVEKRNHIAGNCFDKKNSKGILIHKYGPHYMRFKKRFLIM